MSFKIQIFHDIINPILGGFLFLFQRDDIYLSDDILILILWDEAI